jgi:hydroxymethylpyrimidine/phosphomethylpyrimidine kinase
METLNSCCLTIAGSDSGGNAGIQADLRTFHAYNLHGCSVITALTAQNPFEVSAIHYCPGNIISAQLDAVLNTYSIKALKTGMLGSSETIEIIAGKLSKYPDIAKIIDPVVIATSGAKLINDNAISSLKKSLLPLATLITPNIPEAEAISGIKITSKESLHSAAKKIYDSFGTSVVIKGGHFFDEEKSDDVFYDGKSLMTFSSGRISNPISTHGTGCSFAAAIAAELTLGASLPDAIKGAKKYVYDSIVNSFFVGPECGVLGFVKNRI